MWVVGQIKQPSLLKTLKPSTMINIKYRWHSLKTKTDLFGQKFEALFELYMPEKYVDGNFFNSKEDAIKWMEQRIKEDELFADCDTLILTEMYFT